jgi:hypothetical protein
LKTTPREQIEKAMQRIEGCRAEDRPMEHMAWRDIELLVVVTKTYLATLDDPVAAPLRKRIEDLEAELQDQGNGLIEEVARNVNTREELVKLNHAYLAALGDKDRLEERVRELEAKLDKEERA